MLAIVLPIGLAMVVAPPATKVVMKFGGSSVRDAERITEVCKLVSQQLDDGLKPHLVCSAMGKSTNNLLSAADRALSKGEVDLSAMRILHAETAATLKLESSPYYLDVLTLLDECERTLEGVAMLGELSTRTRDRIVSYGERCSGRMVAATLEGMGIQATQVESWDLGVMTDSTFGDARVLDACWPTINQKVAEIPEDTVAVITGFIGKDENGAITTLGRGGSDLTASLIAAAAGYDEAQVWKDVDGILSADPRVCPGAVPVPSVSYEEAAELAYFGAQVSDWPWPAVGLGLQSAPSLMGGHAGRSCGRLPSLVHGCILGPVGRGLPALWHAHAGFAPACHAAVHQGGSALPREEFVQPIGTRHAHHPVV